MFGIVRKQEMIVGQWLPVGISALETCVCVRLQH